MSVITLFLNKRRYPLGWLTWGRLRWLCACWLSQGCRNVVVNWWEDPVHGCLDCALDQDLQIRSACHLWSADRASTGSLSGACGRCRWQPPLWSRWAREFGLLRALTSLQVFQQNKHLPSPKNFLPCASGMRAPIVAHVPLGTRYPRCAWC